MLSVVTLCIIMPNVIMPSVVIPSVIIPRVIMPNAIMQNIIMPSVVLLSAHCYLLADCLAECHYAKCRYAECRGSNLPDAFPAINFKLCWIKNLQPPFHSLFASPLYGLFRISSHIYNTLFSSKLTNGSSKQECLFLASLFSLV